MIKLRTLKLKSKKGLNLTFIHALETSFGSILADIITSIVLIIWFAGLYFNFKYLGDSFLIKIFILGILIIYLLEKNKQITKKYCNKDEFITAITRAIEENIND